MPIEPPNPNNLTAVEALRVAMAALRTAAELAPHDARVVVAIGHVGAALTVLDMPDPRSSE